MSSFSRIFTLWVLHCLFIFANAQSGEESRRRPAVYGQGSSSRSGAFVPVLDVGASTAPFQPDGRLVLALQMVENLKESALSPYSDRDLTRAGPGPVREMFAAHLTGHVQARLHSSGAQTPDFIRRTIRTKMWDFTRENFTPVLHRRVLELIRTYPGDHDNHHELANSVKARITADLPLFAEFDLAAEQVVNRRVREAYDAAVAGKLFSPSSVAAQRLSDMQRWRLQRSEYDEMIEFVNLTIDGMITSEIAKAATHSG